MFVCLTCTLRTGNGFVPSPEANKHYDSHC